MNMHAPSEKEIQLAKRYMRLMNHLAMTIPDGKGWEIPAYAHGNAEGWLEVAATGAVRRSFKDSMRGHFTNTHRLRRAA